VEEISACKRAGSALPTDPCFARYRALLVITGSPPVLMTPTPPARAAYRYGWAQEADAQPSPSTHVAVFWKPAPALPAFLISQKGAMDITACWNGFSLLR